MNQLLMINLDITLNMLSGESCVMIQELASDKELLAMIKAGSSYEDLLQYINENY